MADDDGLLALSIVTPVAIPPLTLVLREPALVEGFGGSIWERALAARARILQRVTELTGAQLSRVDIRISGTAVHGRRRVRCARMPGTTPCWRRPRRRRRMPATSPLGAGAAGMERILRRETHPSRAVVSMIAAALVSVVCGYALLETGGASHRPAVVARGSADGGRALCRAPGRHSAASFGRHRRSGDHEGLFFFLNAVLPGQQARHLFPDRRAAVVVDDEVIAAALARRARLAANVTPEQVMVVVSGTR